MNTPNPIFFILISLILCSHIITAQPHPNADKQKTEALSYMKSGRYGEAIDLLNNYISARPQQAEGYNLRGLAYEHRGQYEQAVYDFRSARKLEPENSDIRNNLAHATEQWYKLIYNEIEGYKREIAINPSVSENYLQIGRLYKNLGEWAEAELWYDKYLSMDNASPDEIIRYTEILAKNDHLSKGEPILKRYTEKYPDDQRLWSRYGYFLLWLGKTRSAVNAFEKALELKPFFKEAMDGLARAKGNGYVYTFNDTASYRYYKYGTTGPGYAIDIYFRKLKRDPNDNDTRIKLIYALMKAERYEEAYQQLEILKTKEGNIEEVKKLSAEVLSARENYYNQQIIKYRQLLKEKPGSRDILLKLAGYYSGAGKYSEAIKLYAEYLALYPDDPQIRFLYIRNAAWNRQYQLAGNELDVMIVQYPDSLKYKLLRAKLYVWQNKDLNEAEKLLKAVLKVQPDNFDALLTMAMLNSQQNKYTDAEYYVSLAGKIRPSDEEIARLSFNIDKQKNVFNKNNLYLLLEEARKKISNNDCYGALDLYKEYNSRTSPDNNVLMEEADAYVCAKDYQSAIDIYNELLNNGYDYNIAKKKAKVIFWSSNPHKALGEFEDLYARNPSDAEVRMYIGDCYMQLKDYAQARKIYNEMIAEYPGSKLIKTRLGWLGEGQGSAFSLNFPTYFFVSPEASYYFDNYDFKYSLQSLVIEAGINNYLSFGVSAQRGELDSASSRLNFYTAQGLLSIRFNGIWSMRLAAGQTFFENNENVTVGSAYLKAEGKSYSARLDYISQDAARVLYSPLLVDRRLKTDMVRLSGEYRGESGLLASGYFNYYFVSDQNQGNNLQLRIGKRFGELSAGYEFYYLSFKDSAQLYYSPYDFESHSLWGEWNIVQNNNNEVKLGGKVGIIPENNFILREAFLSARVLLAENFTLQGRLSLGSTVRQNTGYRSASFNVAAYWTF
jgi:tetratricopeptide (TPR) repeat protein